MMMRYRRGWCSDHLRPPGKAQSRIRACWRGSKPGSAPEMLPASHFVLGAMTAEDWGYWAYRLADHHLRQFGV